MTNEEMLDKLLKDLIWHGNNDMPVGQERIAVIYSDGSMGCDYAINKALYWQKVERWVYVSEILNIIKL